MKNILTTCLVALALICRSQTIVFDRQHFNIVNENSLMRYSAEQTHAAQLHSIQRSLSDVSLNISSVVLVQSLIKASLTQVDQALKNGIAVKQVGLVIAEIISECNSMITEAGSEPHLLLFAEATARQLKNRGVNLATDVSNFILKEEDDVMLDYEKRDALLQKVLLELKVMRALCFGMRKSIHWARINGVLKTINPYRHFLNRDKRLSDDITMTFRHLKMRR